jgi:hypothetical protein
VCQELAVVLSCGGSRAGADTLLAWADVMHCISQSETLGCALPRGVFAPVGVCNTLQSFNKFMLHMLHYEVRHGSGPGSRPARDPNRCKQHWERKIRGCVVCVGGGTWMIGVVQVC